jgi:CHAT domain-containing protein
MWLAGFDPDVAAYERETLLMDTTEHIGGEIWTLLIDPLEKALARLGMPENARLIFLPAAGFGLLPLGLAEEPATRRRLIERHEIVYALSLDVIDPIGLAPDAPTFLSLAAVAANKNELFYASTETAFAAAHFDAPTCLEDATATDVLAAIKGKSHWHFAVHGSFDFRVARQSALILKGGERLSVGALFEAGDLGEPRLVVLSACETGLHDILQNPDEFIGFPAAFMSLGAKAVLATLWPANDCANTLLIARFYDAYIDEGFAPAAALRTAQLWLQSTTAEQLIAYVEKAAAGGQLTGQQLNGLRGGIKNMAAKNGADKPNGIVPFAHPRYWACFIITGL